MTDSTDDNSTPDNDTPNGHPISSLGWYNTAAQYAWRGLVLLTALTAAMYVATQIYLVTLPIILALVLATLCVPPARRLERLGLPRALSATIVVVGGIGGVVGGVIALIPPFVTQGQELVEAVSDGIDSILIWLEEGPIGYDREEVLDLINQGLTTLENSAGDIALSLGTFAVGVAQGLTALILAVVLLFFFVKDGNQIVDWFIDRSPERHRNTVRACGARGWVALSGFVRGTALVALIDAVGIGIGLYIVDVPLVIPLAVLVFFGSFIPVIGAFIAGILAVLVALASNGPVTALIVVGIVLAVQQFEGNVLQPTIMRRSVSLHPVVILGVLTAGTILIGVIGAFLAVPITAVIAAVGNELRLRRLAQNAGHFLTATPIGGPRVNPVTALPILHEDDDDTKRRWFKPTRDK
ncbi:MAG: AI-2E family transporter [Nitriliruptoraceae bacterium]